MTGTPPARPAPSGLAAALQGTTGRRIALLIAISTTTTAAIFVISALQILQPFGGDLRTLPNDFAVFWHSARLGLEGRAVEAFDTDLLLERTDAGRLLPWLYPPGFLLLLAPLGALPFWAAWVFWITVSILVYAVAARAALRRSGSLWIVTAFSPSILQVILGGQTSLLWAAVLALAVVALSQQRRIRAGVLIGLLTLKPHLGLLVPVALIARGEWRAIAAAAATAAVLVVVPSTVFGWSYWPLFGEAIQARLGGLAGAAEESVRMLSPYVGFRRLGAGPDVASALQWTTTALLGLAVARVWINARSSVELRGAVLFLAIPISVPHLWFYEAVLLPIAAALMVRGGILPRGFWGAVLFVVLWLNSMLFFVPGRDLLPIGGLDSLLAFPIGIGIFLCIRALPSREAAC